MLAKWLNEQRQIYIGNRGKKTLTKEQIERLEAIGMTWGKRTRGENPVTRSTQIGMF